MIHCLLNLYKHCSTYSAGAEKGLAIMFIGLPIYLKKKYEKNASKLYALKL